MKVQIFDLAFSKTLSLQLQGKKQSSGWGREIFIPPHPGLLSIYKTDWDSKLHLQQKEMAFFSSLRQAVMAKTEKRD